MYFTSPLWQESLTALHLKGTIGLLDDVGNDVIRVELGEDGFAVVNVVTFKVVVDIWTVVALSSNKLEVFSEGCIVVECCERVVLELPGKINKMVKLSLTKHLKKGLRENFFFHIFREHLLFSFPHKDT